MDSFEGNSSDPASLHKYAYCWDNPASNYDPSGHLTLGEISTSTAIGSGLSWGFFGALSGAVTTYRHNGNQLGWNVAGNAAIGGAVGFAGGFFLGPLPPTAWTTGGGPWMLALLSGIAANGAVQEYQAGYADLAVLDAAFAVAPFMLTYRELSIKFEGYIESTLTAAGKGVIGEEAAAKAFARAGYESLKCRLSSNNGPDGVFVKYNADGTISDLVVAESKYAANGYARLSTTKTMGQQMSWEWIDANINLMRMSADPEVAQTGDLLFLNRDVIARKVNVVDQWGVNRWNTVTLPQD